MSALTDAGLHIIVPRSVGEIKATVPGEGFRADIEAVTTTKVWERKSSAGRKPYDAILKFKVLVLQSLYNLSDERTGFLIRDRLSFIRFLDLGLEDPEPDAPTIWLFARRFPTTIETAPSWPDAGKNVSEASKISVVDARDVGGNEYAAINGGGRFLRQHEQRVDQSRRLVIPVWRSVRVLVPHDGALIVDLVDFPVHLGQVRPLAARPVDAPNSLASSNPLSRLEL